MSPTGLSPEGLSTNRRMDGQKQTRQRKEESHPGPEKSINACLAAKSYGVLKGPTILFVYSGDFRREQTYPELQKSGKVSVRRNSTRIPLYHWQSGATAEKPIPRKISRKFGTLAGPA
ncbi:hypothetical protein T265_10469 [Opisthorchis viverrini]|uniref:Uncharacterized protein n=1 Tax=Opisthorchis viverrini TaxID=6198 RepID=A0A074Z2C4_OPIVI|nr:hypothetical protein T265_10469 [Opisthorchis viverrini]KER21138.1 hypothetical protein T265_10469 [Opisthorchis viverrini]